MLQRIPRKILVFLRLAWSQKTFFFVNIVLCGIARVAIFTRPLSRLSPYFGKFYQTAILSTILSNEAWQQAQRIGRAVRMAAKYTPWDSSCLTQAMVAAFWCRRFKVPHVFYIGFTKSADPRKRFEGHAWLMAGPIAVTGGQGRLNYTVVSTYVYFPEKDIRVTYASL